MDVSSAYAEYARANESSEAERAAFFKSVVQAFLRNFPGTVLEPVAPIKVCATPFDLVQRFTVQDCAFFIACVRSSRTVGLLYQTATMSKPWFLTMGLSTSTEKTQILQHMHAALTRSSDEN